MWVTFLCWSFDRNGLINLSPLQFDIVILKRARFIPIVCPRVTIASILWYYHVTTSTPGPKNSRLGWEAYANWWLSMVWCAHAWKVGNTTSSTVCRTKCSSTVVMHHHYKQQQQYENGGNQFFSVTALIDCGRRKLTLVELQVEEEFNYSERIECLLNMLIDHQSCFWCWRGFEIKLAGGYNLHVALVDFILTI